MNRRIITFTLLGLLISLMTACAPVAIRNVEEQGGVTVSFPELLARPQAYEGKLVVLGGYVLAVANQPGGSTMTVLQAPLDSQTRPGEKDESQGRFLVRTDKFLDPEVYQKDRKVTVGGKFVGMQQQKIEGAPYSYPLIEAREIYLWSKEELPPYYPYPYPYPYLYPWFYPRYPFWF